MRGTLRGLVPVFLFIPGGGGYCAGAKQWTLDAIMDLKTVSDPEITADGEKVAYVVRGRDARRNVYSDEMWVVAAGGGPGRRLAAPHDSDDHPRWSANCRTLAFLSRRDGKAQVYVVDTPEAAPHRLTNSPTDLTHFEWSRDGRYIGYLAADADPEREAKRKQGDDAMVGGEGYSSTRLHILPLSGGEARVLPVNIRHLLSFDWAPDGSRVVYAVQKSPQ